jgi:hypothetical protein
MHESGNNLYKTEIHETPTVPFDKKGASDKTESALLNKVQPRLAICLMKYAQLVVILPDSQEKY